MNKLFIISLLLFSFYFWSCNDVKNKSNHPTDSELTLLMRGMEEDMKLIRQHIKEGTHPAFPNRYKKIFDAPSTEKGKSESADFKVYAQSYLAAMSALENANAEQTSTSYDIVVSTCMNCHQAMCPGPMVRIKKLYVEN